ncbi:unnamed protein product [Clonostachys byssicola]|uniref:Ankyrin repeat protein n=1 Tax=Clonostachys byssicola TaxID=160290 RepID=A0A9N9XYZ5_9HYPO|nr:unnamed protein product [Clonostachys byssicola]
MEQISIQRILQVEQPYTWPRRMAIWRVPDSYWKRTGQTPLLVAASQGRIDLITLLIGHGADIHARDNDGYGCLHLSARAEHYDVTKLFLDLGISVNARANDDATPLHGAAVEGNLGIVKLLISKGADINATKLSGVTPLMRAISYGHITIFRLLLEHGATVGKHTYLLNLAKMQLRDTREY